MQGNFTTQLNTITLPELTDLVRHEWVFTQENISRNAKQLFIVEQIGEGNGSSKRFDEIDTETYSDYKPEGTPHTKSRVGIGYYKLMESRTYSKEIEITIEMRRHNRYREAGSLIVNLSEFCMNRQDLDLTHIFTFANATSYVDRNGETIDLTVGDGLALLSAVHTLAHSSVTYNNIVSGNPAFSQGSFEAALNIGAQQILSNFGEKRQMNFNTIITGNDAGTMREVRQLLRSMADVDAAQAGIENVYKGIMNHVVLPNLATTALGAHDSTKRRWWFIASINGMNGWQAYLGEWMAPTLMTPNSGNNGEDIHTANWTYATICMYGRCVVSPKGLIGSCPTS